MGQSNSLQIIICKLTSINLPDNQKIHVLIQKQKEKMYSSSSTVRNGTANFYRQKFQLVGQICQFNFKIFNCQNNLLLCCLTVKEQIVKQISYHTNTFETAQGSYHFFWQAQFMRESVQKDIKSEQKRSNEISVSFSEEFLIMEHSDKKKKRNGSFIINNEDTQSEPGQIFQNYQNDSINAQSLVKKFSYTYDLAENENLLLIEKKQKLDQLLLSDIQSEESISQKKIEKQSTKRTIHTPQKKMAQKINYFDKQPKEKEKQIKIKQKFISKPNILNPHRGIRKLKEKPGILSKLEPRYLIVMVIMSTLFGIFAANL